MKKRPAAEQRAQQWAEKLVARINPVDLERLSAQMLTTIDRVSAARWDAAVERAATLKGDIRPEKIRNLTNSLALELGAFGGAAGVAAAAPMVGTAATVLATTAELAWFTTRAGDLILTVAALHGRPNPTVDERRAWLLAVLIYGGSARDGFTTALNQVATGLSPAAGSKVSLATLQSVNRLMSRMLIRRYGTRRGLVALGTALPLGLGAVVGGGSNYMAIRKLARHADEFFTRLPYSAIDATAIDITGRLPRSTS